MNISIEEKMRSLKLVSDWLLKAQFVNGDGGYSHSYTIFKGWGKSYPETTGYIIPTMLAAGEILKDDRYGNSAAMAGEWLLSVQGADGAFADLSGEKRIFDTGQAIEGLLALYIKSKDSKFLKAAVRAGDFLSLNQDQDGKWMRHSYNNMPHTYYTRVAANLSKLYRVTGAAEYKEAAQKNVRWAVGYERPNGYFDLASFSENQLPYLHTIVYTLEGLWTSHEIFPDDVVLAGVTRAVEGLLTAERKASVLYAQYDNSWQHLKKERCLTGLAQWASLLFKMHSVLKKQEYLDSATKTLAYLMKKQVRCGLKDINGALPGSDPIWGSYFRFSFNNWTAKFFADALIASGLNNYTGR